MRKVARLAGILFAVGTIAGLIVLAFLVAGHLQARPRTDDAYLYADVIHFAPDVSGRIVTLNVANNQSIQRGEALFTIDPEPYRYRVEQARANLRALEAELAVETNQVASQNSNAKAAHSGIGTAETQLGLATRTVARLEPLLGRGYVTQQSVDQARSAEVSARISLLQSREKAAQATQAVNSTEPLADQVASSRATLALAERDLRLTTARAPCDGRITALESAAGEYATMGEPLFSIIDTERWWAVGNFRETELAGMQPGERARVFVMIKPQVVVRGMVDSLGFGVAPDEGATTGGLPHVPRSLDWVRIAQRFPVRVLLDRPPPDLMRLGATAVIVIDR